MAPTAAAASRMTSGRSDPRSCSLGVAGPAGGGASAPGGTPPGSTSPGAGRSTLDGSIGFTATGSRRLGPEGLVELGVQRLGRDAGAGLERLVVGGAVAKGGHDRGDRIGPEAVDDVLDHARALRVREQRSTLAERELLGDRAEGEEPGARRLE